MSDRLQRLTMWILAVIAVVGTALALRYVKGYRPLSGLSFLGDTGLPADIALRFDNVTVVGRSENKKAWELQAGSIQTNQLRTRLDFSHAVSATLMNEGKPRATLTVPQATYDINAKILVAAGQVNCRIFPVGAGASHSPQRDLTISSDQLVWTAGAHRISCPGRIEATAPGVDLKGTDLFVDLQTGEKTLNFATADVAIGTDGSLGGGDAAGPLSLKEYVP